jgi:hypothetical protein
VIRNSIDVYSNSNFQGSAKFNAMGGSNGALGGDANSLLTNPAGLGVAISGEISGTLGVQSYQNTSTLAGASNSYRNTRGDLSNVGGVLTFQLMTESAWKFINLGVNFSSQSLDNYIETPGNSNIDFTFAGNTNASLARHAYDRTGSLTKSSFGVGANYNNTLYLGAGLNFFNASFDQSDTAALNSAGNTDLYSKQGTPFNEASSGFSASFGVIGKLNKNFRLGAAIETPTFWQIDRSYSFYNDPQFGDDFAAESRRFNSPLKATASAAYVANKNFSMNVDYSIGITKPKYSVRGAAERELNDFFSDNSRSMQEVRVGAEYRMKQFRLRGGYGYASNPMDALTVSAFNNGGGVEDRSYSNLILSDRNTVSFGLGYDFKSFYIDASYQNMISKFANPFLFGYIDGATGVDSAYYSPSSFIESDAYAVSDVKTVRNNFFLTLGWKF